jgi:thymidylate synthase
MQINAKTLGEAHEKVLKLILTEGEELLVEPGPDGKREITIEYPPEDPVMIRVTGPLDEPRVSRHYPKGPKAIAEYCQQVLKLHPPGPMTATYYYSNRWFDYPCVGHDGDRDLIDEGDGDGRGINQVLESIIRRLAKQPNSRRAVVISWVPRFDIDSPEPPCVQIIQCFIRGNQLHMVVYIRSNDMLSAWLENAHGFTAIMCFITDEINRLVGKDSNLSPGILTTISASAHIYFERDKHELNKMRQALGV